MPSHQLPHIAGRIFNTPLLIQQRKLDTILSVLGSRIGAPKLWDFDDDDDDGPDADDLGADSKPYQVTQDSIAVISVSGCLVRKGFGPLNALSGLTSYMDVEDQFLDAVTDPNVKGILFDIDSPGGEAGGVFDLADQIYSQRGNKPIYAVADDDMFSAAYAIGSAADKVFVTRTGGVGSIGVICLHVDQSAFDATEGFKYTAIFAGDHKNDMSPHEPLSDDAKTTMQAEIDRIYGMFVDTVARNRNMSAATVRDTQASLFFGPNGQASGLADEVGTFADALKALSDAVAPEEEEAPPQPIFNNSAGTSVAAQSNKGGLMSKPNEAADPTTAAQQPPAPQGQVAEVPAGALMNGLTTGQQVVNAQQPPVPPAVTRPSYSVEEAEEVMQLCAIAGKPLSAAEGYVSKRMKPSDVRRELAAEKATASEEQVITSHVLPSMGTEPRQKAINLEESPIVKLAESMRQNGQNGHGRSK